MPDIATNGTATIRLDAVVQDDAPAGPITNRALISAPGVLKVSRAATNTITASPVLDNTSTSKTVSPSGTVERGRDLRYTVSVRHTGNTTATGVTVQDPIPEGVTYLPNTLTVDGIDQNADEWPATIAMPDIAPNFTKSITFTVRVNPTTEGGKITNTATIMGNGIPPFTRSVTNSVSAFRVVTPPPPPPPTCKKRDATQVGIAFADIIIGTNGPDVIVGLGGDDIILGLGGNDVICSGPGDDLIRGGTGADKLYGEAGDDALLGGPGRDLLVGAAGEDLLRGGDGIDNLRGGGGDDGLFGGPGNDKLLGGGGNDVLVGRDGDDLVNCGAGNKDFGSGGAGADTIKANCETKLN